MESDPIGLRGGMNTYRYVGGNPLLRVDPKGLNSLVGIAGVGWIGSCAYYGFHKGMTARFSDAINPDLPSSTDDKKRHCYASCLMTKCMLGLPMAPAIGVVKEAIDLFLGSSEVDYIRANNVGIGYAYRRLDCKKCDGKKCGN